MSWTMERKLFSKDAGDVFAMAVEHRRTMLQLPVDAMKGTRFNSDEAVLARMESACGEREFMACPGLHIDTALVDAARSDHWYRYEKDYGTDETEIAEEEDDE